VQVGQVSCNKKVGCNWGHQGFEVLLKQIKVKLHAKNVARDLKKHSSYVIFGAF
jgi:hypothetical protein